jgi:hypothetical protein
MSLGRWRQVALVGAGSVGRWGPVACIGQAAFQ